MKRIFFVGIPLLVIVGIAFGFYFNPGLAASIKKEIFGDDPDMPSALRAVKDQFSKEEFMMKRAENILYYRGLADGVAVDRFARPNAIREMERQQADLAREMRPQTAWTEIGPFSIPNGQTESTSTPVSGRVSAIAIHPTDPNIAYVGTAQGGVYRTTNGGDNWTPIFDSAQSMAIGSVAIAPSQPSTVYVGTGEAGGSCDSFFGVGLYRITNADTSPVVAGPFNDDTAANDVFTGRAVGKVVVHPTNPDIVFAGTTSGMGGLNCEFFGGGTVPPLPPRGLYRSSNATGAFTFTKMTTATGTNVVAGNWPNQYIAMDPNNPSRVLVSVNAPINPAGGGTGGGVYFSTDALVATPTFTRTLSLESVRIELALQSAGGVVNVYAASGESNGMLRRSTDGGATWSAALAAASGFCSAQCFYDIAVAVDPSDPLKVLIGGNVTGASTKLIARSIDGGASFTNVASGVHADNHAVEFAPSNVSTLYMGTDGGIYKSTDNGVTWTSKSNATFSATQFQSIAVHPTDANFTIGGTQDNGTQCQGPCGTIPGTGWRRADFGDGGHALIDQNAVNTTTVTMYHTYFNQSNAKGYARATTSATATDNGWVFYGCGFAGSIPNGMVCSGPTLFYAPMTLGGGNPNTLYFGADRLYRSSDSGVTVTTVSQLFTSAISAVGVSKTNDNVRIVGLTNGTVFRTSTGANPLTNVTPPTSVARGVGRIVVDPNDVNTAYVTYTGFSVPAGEHIWKTTTLSSFGEDALPTWVSSGNGIPDVPVNAIAVDPTDSNRVFAGTDIGVYVSLDGGANWVPFGSGLPRVAVFDLAITNVAPRQVRIATHGRGMWQNPVLAPTAATVSVAGRVMNEGGFGVPRVTVSIVDGQGGARETLTNSFGYYRFDDVQVGLNYTFQIFSKRYQFEPRVIFVTEEMENVDFTTSGSPRLGK
jgi:hypothetical protein